LKAADFGFDMGFHNQSQSVLGKSIVLSFLPSFSFSVIFYLSSFVINLSNLSTYSKKRLGLTGSVFQSKMQPFHAHLNKTPLDNDGFVKERTQDDGIIDDEDDNSPNFSYLSNNFPVTNSTSLIGSEAVVPPSLLTNNHSAGTADGATQQDHFDTQLDGSDPSSCPEALYTENDTSKPWAKLIAKDGSMSNYELMWTNPDEEERYNLYSLGRSPLNSIRFDYSPRISSNHCLLYCKKNLTFDRNKPFFEAYIVDLSANGTFVNGTRLTKNIPRQLHNGDVICFINPKLASQIGSNITVQDVEKCSFGVFLELFNPMTQRKSTRSRTQTLMNHSAGDGSSGNSGTSSSCSSGSQPNLPIGRSNTVIRLLTQKRSIFDFYEFRELLGQGGVAAVHLGVKKDTGAPWAIKVIDTRQFQLTEGGIDSLTREAEMLRSLRHPNIIHLEDIFSDASKLYLVMELSHGGDLFDRILSKRRYEEATAKEAMRNILSALAYLHKSNIAHRDLKPENILLSRKDSDTDVKISDFGLAKVASDKQKLKTYCGTPQYFAPEVLQRKNTVAGQGSYSLAADMWSIGIILFVMLAGEFPFDDPTKRGVNAMKHQFNKPVWATISNDAKDLINKLLIKDPSDRLNAEQALRHPWFTGQPYSLTASVASADVVDPNSAGSTAASAGKPKSSGRSKKAAEPSARPPVPPAFFPPPSGVNGGGAVAESADHGKRKAEESTSTASDNNQNRITDKQEAPQTPSKRSRKANTMPSPGEAKEGQVVTESDSGKIATPGRIGRKKAPESAPTPVKNSMDKYVIKK
jgi:serine/threonine protein kinase